MWHPKQWTPWTTPSGTPLSSSSIQTVSTVSRPWDRGSPPTPTVTPANSTNKLSNWGRPAPTYSLVQPTQIWSHLPLLHYLNVSFEWVWMLFSSSHDWSELSQRRLVRQRQRLHQGAADAGCLGFWWQGKHTHAYWFHMLAPSTSVRDNQGLWFMPVGWWPREYYSHEGV